MAFATNYLTCWIQGNYEWSGPASQLIRPYKDLVGTTLNTTSLNGIWDDDGGFTMDVTFGSKAEAYDFCAAMRDECEFQFPGVASGAYMVFPGSGSGSFLFVTFTDKDNTVHETCDTVLVPPTE